MAEVVLFLLAVAELRPVDMQPLREGQGQGWWRGTVLSNQRQGHSRTIWEQEYVYMYLMSNPAFFYMARKCCARLVW